MLRKPKQISICFRRSCAIIKANFTQRGTRIRSKAAHARAVAQKADLRVCFANPQARCAIIKAKKVLKVSTLTFKTFLLLLSPLIATILLQILHSLRRNHLLQSFLRNPRTHRRNPDTLLRNQSFRNHLRK